MSKRHRRSLSVTMSLMARLKDCDEGVKNDILHKVTGILLDNGVITSKDINAEEIRFVRCLLRVKEEMSNGVSQDEAIKHVSDLLPDYSTLLLN